MTTLIKRKPFKTLYVPKFFSDEESTKVYNTFQKNIKWDEGIKSKGKKHTRYAKALDLEEDEDK